LKFISILPTPAATGESCGIDNFGIVKLFKKLIFADFAICFIRSTDASWLIIWLPLGKFMISSILLSYQLFI
jgi:hypothetical protein